MNWVSILGGSVSLQGRELAKIKEGDEWCFQVERPYEANEKSLAEVIQERLPGARGHFVLGGGASDDLLNAIRRGAELTLRGQGSRGEVEAEVKVDPSVTQIPDTIIELFPFTVTGGVWFTQRS